MPTELTGRLGKGRGAAPVIDPEAVFTIEQARATLQLAKNCLPREIRLGRLRVAKRAGKYLILGEWLLQWVASGELPRRRSQSQSEANSAPATT
jgi:hypothetical protein